MHYNYNSNNKLVDGYINARREYWWLSIQVFSAALLAALSVIFIEIYIIWGNSTCYTLPLNMQEIDSGRDEFIVLLIILMLVWSPLIIRKRYIKYTLLTVITIAPTIYYMISAMPHDSTWHNGLCW